MKCIAKQNRRIRIGPWALAALLLVTATKNASGVTGAQEFRPARIASVHNTAAGLSVSVVGLNEEDTRLGDKLEFYRRVKPLRGDEWVDVKTGFGQVVALGRGIVMATVTEDQHPEAAHFFKKFAQVMGQDLVRKHVAKIESRQYVLEEQVLPYHQVFENPDRESISFELLSQGKSALIEAIQPLLDSQEGTILIEGHTDHHGPAHLNQIESYHRAFAVKQFLTRELNLDPERLAEVGFGESQLPDRDFVPGYERRHRRIVLKLIPPEF